MKSAVKKTISLPSDLAKEVEEMAREEGKPVSAVIQDALRLAKRERLKKNFYQVQNYWSRKAQEKGILTERDLERYPSQGKQWSTFYLITRSKPELAINLRDAAHVSLLQVPSNVSAEVLPNGACILHPRRLSGPLARLRGQAAETFGNRGRLAPMQLE